MSYQVVVDENKRQEKTKKVKKIKQVGKLVATCLFLLTAICAIQYGVWNAYVNNDYRWQRNVFLEQCECQFDPYIYCVAVYTCGSEHLNPPAKYYGTVSQSDCSRGICAKIERYVDYDTLGTNSVTAFQILEFMIWLGVLFLCLFCIIISSLIIEISFLERVDGRYVLKKEEQEMKDEDRKEEVKEEIETI